MSERRDLALASKAWPFEEARRLLARYGEGPPAKGHVLFQTGYGPSGLPHIGTFAEVVRTSMVRRAFAEISDVPTRLVCFSDDMDGLRKVPENVPDREGLREDLHLPLSRVRDPWGCHEGFAQHNNAMLRSFLDGFGFEYEFLSASETYRSGAFDATLLAALERYDAIMEIMLPTLGPERRATYSPFLPVSPRTGRVLQVPTLERDAARGTIVYEEPDGERVEIPVTGGRCKMQWKADWALRWAALGVDYEMSGKDLIESVQQSTRICRALGARPPETLSYELFLDADGQKISKSKGNGLSVEEWLRYAPPESLSSFMFLKPRTAKRLHLDAIPKMVDEHHQHLRAYPGQDDAQRLANPAWHVHAGEPPESRLAVPYAMLLNLASAAGAADAETLWAFVRRYAPGATPETHPDLARAAEGAVRYTADIVLPGRRFRPPDARERAAMADLAARLRERAGETDAEALQSVVFEVGRTHGFEPLRDWFRALYEVLLGASQGPRFGGFAALYGPEGTAALIDRALEREAA